VKFPFLSNKQQQQQQQQEQEQTFSDKLKNANVAS
jgi:hypothetical protein